MIFAAIFGLAHAARAAATTPRDGMVVHNSVTLSPGTYVLPKGISIAGDGISVNATGVTLIGAGKGQAILARDAKHLTIRGLHAEGYRWGINIHGGAAIAVENCRIRDTAEEKPDEVWLDIWRGPEQPYGAGILLWNVRGGSIVGNDVQHQQNGISMYGCSNITVARNNASFESGWGIHLNNSSDNVIEDNIADWCNRIHKRGERNYYPGADAAGLLMVSSSSRNTVRRNFFRGGGDGVFIAGFKAPDTKAPCNDNLIEDNDGSYSPNNAFESTFSRGNTFRNNRANASNYGFWLGYSTDNVVDGNEIRHNRIAGIAVEHGLRNMYRENKIEANNSGLVLWSRSGRYSASFPDQTASAKNQIQGNVFTGNGVGFYSRRTGADAAADPRGDTLSGNIFYGNHTGALLKDSESVTFTGNRFQANSTGLRIEGGREMTAAGNYFIDEGTHAWADEAVTWVVGTGNYWGGADGPTYTPAGPMPGTDTAPLKEAPPLPAGRFRTQDAYWLAIPG